jgi:hypothetical protein
MGPTHNYEDKPHRSITLYRWCFERIDQDGPDWRPYDENVLTFLPPIYNDQDHRSIYHYRGPLIFFWIVEWHYLAQVA